MEDIKKGLQDISQDVKVIVDKVHQIDKETVKNTAILAEHQRRSAANEERITKLEDRELDLKSSQLRDKAANGGITAVLLLMLEIVRRFL